MDVEQLNFHHLRYFWAVARDGALTRAAARLRVAPSALSAQVRALEQQLGHALFLRRRRQLELTEAGRLVLAHAERVFAAGAELLATLGQGRARDEPLRVGAVATLSRNFQESFIQPLLAQPDVHLRLESGVLRDLLARLERHSLDLVLANRAPARAANARTRCRRIARQPVSVIGARARRGFRFPAGLAGTPLILPGHESAIRAEFDALCEQLGIAVRILAEVDDMATMRLLARDSGALALLPSVVVRDELRQGRLHELCVVPGLFESFYAITVPRSFQHPLLAVLLDRDEEELLAAAGPAPRRP